MDTSFTRAETIFRRHHGLLRTAQAVRLGIAPRTLYAMRDAGVLQQLARGVYRLADLPPLSRHDLTLAAVQLPRGVICLISALDYHDMTTQVPHEVYVALPRQAQKPRLDYPPLRAFWFSGQAYTAGVEEHRLDGVPVRIYSPAKTVADCFKFRNQIGLEVALEALKRGHADGKFTLQHLLDFARICRVEQIMRPYLEMLA
jgi:predicted transcriptional regulator of viral defense system